MNYRKFGKTGIEVSALGFGIMRLPTADGTPRSGLIDDKESIRMLRDAIDQGLNYVDTAFYYHAGKSEEFVGRALQDGYRNKVYIADKMPVYAFKPGDDFDKIFEEQLRRLQTDHIDFYLLHSMNHNSWQKYAVEMDFLSKMEKLKRDGKVGHIGFSFHDKFEAFQTIVDGYDKWDFCQIQLNYIDVNFQAGIRGLEYAASKGLGVVIMEPLQGGRLANPPESVKRILPKDRSPVEWALDFLWNRPEVSLLLSGMSSYEQVQQNLQAAGRSSVGMLNQEQVKMFDEVKREFDKSFLVPCTRCCYCLPCKAVDLHIPKLFELYNMTLTHSVDFLKVAYQNTVGVPASACKACHQCEKVCPQGIKISELMPKIHNKFMELGIIKS